MVGYVTTYVDWLPLLRTPVQRLQEALRSGPLDLAGQKLSFVQVQGDTEIPPVPSTFDSVSERRFKKTERSWFRGNVGVELGMCSNLERKNCAVFCRNPQPGSSWRGKPIYQCSTECFHVKQQKK